MIYVMYKDEREEEITVWFAGEQPEETFQNIGTVEADDPRWHKYYSKFPGWMSEGMPIPTYAPPVDLRVKMPEIESNDMPAEDVN